mgnify:CR=1 FL=1
MTFFLPQYFRHCVESFYLKASGRRYGIKVGVYPMTALPNTPFFDPEYIKEYEIDIVETTPAFYHQENAELLKNESEYMVVGSKTMTREQYIEASMWKWLFMFGYSLGHLKYIAKFIKSVKNVSYKEFYEKFDKVQEKVIYNQKRFFAYDGYVDDLITKLMKIYEST